jgi:hypothetical protein
MIELNEALRAYRRDFVLVGGWAPYFITKPDFDHCGSLDIDLVFGPKVLEKYESIREVIGTLGFSPTHNPFRFEKEASEGPTVELDILSEEGALRVIPEGFVKVQRDLSAVIIPGSSVALRSNFVAEVTGTLPDGSELSSKIRVADLLAMTALKGHALGRPRKLEKDSYDVYAMLGYTRGGPLKSAAQFNSRFRSGKISSKDRGFVTEALERIGTYFRTENSRGPVAVSRFYGISSARQTDSYQRVNTFLQSVHRK